MFELKQLAIVILSQSMLLTFIFKCISHCINILIVLIVIQVQSNFDADFVEGRNLLKVDFEIRQMMSVN
jgi:hypothetical protein